MDKEVARMKQMRKMKRKLEYQHSKPEPQHHYLAHFLMKFLVVVVLTLMTLISLKTDAHFKTNFYKYVYNTNYSFATVNNMYQKYFGSPIPFKNLVKTPIATVFDEKLTYQEASLYQDGAKLTVDKNYLVPILESGMVVFIGEKNGYGKTVIIQGVNGVDTWYGNMETVNVKLYDYVSKGTMLGEAKDTTLYLVFQKEGKVLNYKDYIK